MAETKKCEYCGLELPGKDQCPACSCPYEVGNPDHPSRKCVCDWCVNKFDLEADPYREGEDEQCVQCGVTRREHVDANITHGSFVNADNEAKPQNVIDREPLPFVEATPCPKCGKQRSGVETHLNQLCTSCREAVEPKPKPNPPDGPVGGLDVLKYLYDKGVISGMCDRVIIDVPAEGVILVYEQRFADQAFMDILLGSPVIMAVKETIKVKSEQPDERTPATQD